MTGFSIGALRHHYKPGNKAKALEFLIRSLRRFGYAQKVDTKRSLHV